MKGMTIKGQCFGLLLLMLVTGFAPSPKTFTIDTDASSATWRWYAKPGQYSGTLYVSSGQLLVDKARINGGYVQFDLSSLSVSTVRDLQENALLSGWLKGQEFFDTYNHPHAVFRLTSIWNKSGSYTLNGSLTIRGKSQPVRIPATVLVEKKRIEISAELIIDETKFRFTGLPTDSLILRNAMIENELRIRLHLVARK